MFHTCCVVRVLFIPMEGGGVEVGGVGAEADDEVAGFPIIGEVGVVEFEIVGGDVEGDVAGFAGLQGDFLEAAEVFDTAGDAGDGLGDVELDGFFSGAGTGVGNTDAGAESFVAVERCFAELNVAVGKGGVAQAKAKGKLRRARNIEVARGVFDFDIAVEGAAGVFVVIVERDLSHAARKGGSEASGRIVIAE